MYEDRVKWYILHSAVSKSRTSSCYWSVYAHHKLFQRRETVLKFLGLSRVDHETYIDINTTFLYYMFGLLKRKTHTLGW